MGHFETSRPVFVQQMPHPCLSTASPPESGSPALWAECHVRRAAVAPDKGQGLGLGQGEEDHSHQLVAVRTGRVLGVLDEADEPAWNW